MIESYPIACLQANVRYIMNPAQKKEVISQNLNRGLELIDSVMRWGGRPKIVTFPEFFLSGFIGVSAKNIDEYRQMSIQIPGDETDVLAKKAVEHGIYIAGGNYEVDDDWPGRLFLTVFVISPEGKVVAKNRTLNVTSSTFSIASSPGDFLSEYVAKYGEDALFPVIDTPLGKLGVASGDMIWPETVRGLVFKGAEVILGCCTGGVRFMFREIAKVRAMENMAYLTVCGAGRILGSPVPETWSSGDSTIVDYKGKVIAQTESLDEAIIVADIDVNQLRKERSRTANNMLAMIRGDIYGPLYQKLEAWPSNRWNQKPIQSTEEAKVVIKEVLERLYNKGTLTRPN